MNQKVKWGNNTYDLYKSPDENSEYVQITVSQPIKA